jgi:hypothetical protein
MRSLAFLTTLVAVAFAFAPSLVRAAPTMPSAAEVDAVASEPVWLRLIHHKDSLTGPGGSDILTPEFFLAPGASRDPTAELTATLEGLLHPPSSADESVRCRFPARAAWLKERLGWDIDLTGACPAYDAWRGAEPITGASLIFASGYLKNPASYYGHILLKLNTGDPTTRRNLLDNVLNYGASYGDHENPVVYLVKGLGGGYEAGYSHLPFYNHQFHYAEAELRDVWEYELNLDPEQVTMLTAHAWEVSGTANRYYFLRQNCAYRLAELINVVVDEPLIPPTKAWVMPIDVFDRLMRKRSGKQLVRRVTRIDSRQNAFRRAYFALDGAGRRAVSDYIDGQETAPDAAAPTPVLEALIDYYSFLDASSDDADQAVKSSRDALLLARLRRPPAMAPKAPAPEGLPHEGQKSSLLQTSWVGNSRLGSGVELRLRPAYHDYLTYAPGVVPGSELAFGDLRVMIRGSKIRLRSLDLVKVTALNLSPTGLARDGGAAWSLRFGVEDRLLSCQDCLVGFLEGGYGKATRLGEQTILYGLVKGRGTAGTEPGSHFSAGPSVGMIFGPERRWRANIETGAWQDLDGDRAFRPFAGAELRLGSWPHWDLRARAEWRKDGAHAVNEARVSLSRYW